MDIEIIEEKQNILFNRKELTVQIHHQNEATPTRDAFRKKIAALSNAELNTVVVRSISGTFGLPRSNALVHIYETPDQTLKTEAKHYLKRNKLIDAEEA